MLFAPTTEPQFVNDPAPAPPTESWSEFDDSLPRESSSAEAVLKSVARVLKGAVDGEDTSERESNGSVLGSIGRALSKGFQEAADSEHTSEE